MKTIKVHIDEAVWLRRTVMVDVADDVPEDEVNELLLEAILNDDCRQMGTEVRDLVKHADPMYMRVDESGNEVEI